jgi:hypothetical protein
MVVTSVGISLGWMMSLVPGLRVPWAIRPMATVPEGGEEGEGRREEGGGRREEGEEEEEEENEEEGRKEK